MTDYVAAAYDEVAELYAELFLDDLDRVPTDVVRLARFAALLPPDAGLVADLGCGPGAVVDHLAGLGVRAIGFDLSPAMIAIARRTFPDSQFEVGDMNALPVALRAIGGIVARYSVIHRPAEDLADTFREWARILAPDAPVLVSFFAAADVDSHGRAFDHKVTTGYQLYPPTVIEHLEEAGIADADVLILPPPPDGRPLVHASILARRR